MTKAEAVAELIRIWHSPHLDLILKARLGEVIEALKGAGGDLISRQDAIKNAHFPMIDDAGYEVVRVDDILALPSAEPKTDEENELKFYYVESIDDYWIGRRLDNFYYADWHEGLGFVWSKSRYLPWGEHIVDENTLWKEHTYPSEPIERPFTEWIKGFVKKYFAEPKTGEWIPVSDIRKLEDVVYMHIDSLEGTRNIVEAGMLSAWKEVAEYVDGMLGEDGEA